MTFPRRDSRWQREGVRSRHEPCSDNHQEVSADSQGWHWNSNKTSFNRLGYNLREFLTGVLLERKAQIHTSKVLRKHSGNKFNMKN